MTIEAGTLIGGLLTFLSNPMSPSSNITWGFFLMVITIIYLVSTAGGK